MVSPIDPKQKKEDPSEASSGAQLGIAFPSTFIDY
jgi:hypothetical protein